MGYFIHDAIVVHSMGTEPNLAPIMAHHVLCSTSLAAMLTVSRPNIWYANLLQWTECTIPIQFVCWLLEIHGADMTWPRTYAVGRWLMAIAWVGFRLILMVGFFYVVWRDWSILDVVSRVIGLVIGPFLTAFNVGGLFKISAMGMI